MSVRERLAAGLARGLGCADLIAAEAASDGRKLRELVRALGDARAAVVGRASNALKKVQAASPRALDPFADELISAALSCAVPEGRWNLMLVVGRVTLTAKQRAVVVDVLLESMRSGSALERVHAMQALADVAGDDASLSERVQGLVKRALDDSSAAVRARARRLSACSAGQHRSKL